MTRASLRPRLRRLRFALLGAIAAVVILLGVVAGVIQLAMPWLERHPETVQAWLSGRIGRPVRIARVEGAWIGGGPVLALHDVHVGAAPGAPGEFSIPQAELALDAHALFRRDRAATEFRLSGLQLTLVREADGWSVQDFPIVAGSGPISLGALGALEIRALQLRVVDAEHDVDLALAVPVVRLVEHGSGLRALARMRPAVPADAPLLDLVVDWDPQARSGLLYAGGNRVDLAAYAGHPGPWGVRPLAGRGVLQAWARIADGRIEDVRARVDLADAAFASASPVAATEALQVEPRVRFDRLAFAARWLRAGEGWMFDLADFTAGDAADARGRLHVRRDGAGPAAQWEAAAAKLPLQPFGDFAMLADAVPAALRGWLYAARPRGMLEGSFAWHDAGDYAMQGSLRGAGLAAAQATPGVDDLDLDFRGDAGALLLELPQQPLRVDYPRLFRWPFLFRQFGGDVVISRDGPGWRLETDGIAFEGEGYGGEVRGSVDLAAGRRPRLDLYGVATHGEVVAAKRFWPLDVMPPSAMRWLDRALVGGSVHGRVAVRGDLADWPFDDRSGIFLAQGEVSDAVLDYHDDWPRAEAIEAVARFINTGMDVSASQVGTLKVDVTQARAQIAAFDKPVLELEAKTAAAAADLLAYLRATPVGARHAAALADLGLRGRARAELALELPIENTDAIQLDGRVVLERTDIRLAKADVAFDDAAGTVRFDAGSVRADALAVRFRERDAALSLLVGGEAGARGHALEATLQGRWPAAAVFADAPALLPVLANLPGESDWQARVDVPPAGTPQPMRLTLASDLAGTAITLPAPLAKAAEGSMPLELGIELPYPGRPFRLRLGDVLVVDGVLPALATPFAARLEFGGGSASAIPARGVTIGGRLRTLDLGGWLDLAPSGAGSVSMLNSLDLRIDDLLLARRHFPQQRLTVRPLASVTEIRFDGAALAGAIQWPLASVAGAPVRAEFARVHWPAAPPDAADADALTLVAPAELPPMQVSVGDFRLGTARFGAAQFESRPQVGGMRVEKFESRSPDLTMQASGDWVGTAAASTSHLAIELGAQNLGHMMAALGFPGLIDGGDTRARIDASFPGPPTAFDLARVEGSLEVKVGEGRILDVEPGAGRLFGLLSLTEIPRRLSLDFSDFFRSGLSFNSISGRFRLTGGDAWTDDLVIKSPAADVRISGRTGLRARDYDQRMQVVPHAGATLPVVGAIAAGPVGAAAGLVMQGILSKPIGRAVERQYHVSGPWEQPLIEQVARGARGGVRTTPDSAGEPAGESGSPLEIEPAPWDYQPPQAADLR